MAFNPTKEQEKAIETKGNILVAAAAGSGKTAVLVERVIRRLTDKTEPISADRLLIVTFTNAAAAEMRTRIEKRIDEEIRRDPENRGLLRQKHLLASAKICTIDTFCIDLVRDNFDKAGVSPDFKMSDGNSLKTVNERIMSDIINERLKSGDPIFTELVDIFGAEYDDTNFADSVLSIYEYSRQLPFPDEWFEFLGNAYNGGVFDKSCLWYGYAFETAKKTVSGMRRTVANVCDMVSEIESADRLVPSLHLAAELLAELSDACEPCDWDLFYNKVETFKLPAFPNTRGFSGVAAVQAAKEVWKSLDKDIDVLHRIFAYSADENNKIFSKLNKPVKLLGEILCELEERLFKAYGEMNTYTFHNTEHLALKLLCEMRDGKLCRKEDAQDIINRYDEIMVDEYQDTNDLQDMLFYVLSDSERKLFAVGDVKQSIYGFRGANPNNFLAKKKRYVPIENANDGDPKKIILKNNFRSRDGVCDYINFFFENIMIEDNSNIVYDGEEMLVPSAVYPEYNCPAAELHIIDGVGSGDDRDIAEARYIASYIRSVVDGGECIRSDEKMLRKARYSDFTILLRAVKGGRAAVIASELRNAGIPAEYGSEGYADSIEISTFLALLKVIDNPQSDIELLTVMLSPIFGFTAEEMACIRADRNFGDLYGAVVFAAENGNKRVSEMLETLSVYRLLAATLPLEQFVSRLLVKSGYSDIISAFPDGERRRNNLRMLVGYAADYNSDGKGSLGGFVKYIQRQSEHGLKSSSAGAGGNSVNIMSIHSSKGLQFPICIIAGTSARFNDSELRNRVAYSSENGIGFKYYAEEEKCFKSSLGREVILNSSKRNSLEEELRLFYVAMTRAEERLVFTCALNNAEKTLGSLQAMLSASGGRIGADIFSKTKSYSDWLLLTALLHPDAASIRNRELFVPTAEAVGHLTVSTVSSENLEERQTAEASEPCVNKELADIISKNIKFRYKYDELRRIEAKYSVSEVANKAESDFYAFSDKPSFMSAGGLTAAKRGTAVHKAMQFFDFSKSDDPEAELDRLYEWKFISEREREAVDVKILQKFFKSDVFARILNSRTVKREMRFLTELPVSSVDGTVSFKDEKIMVQGAVDLCFEEDGEIVVLDFKTDRVNDGGELIAAYKEQLSIYAKACEKIFNKRVKEKIIYSFALGKELHF